MANPGRPRSVDPRIVRLRLDIAAGTFHVAKQTLLEFGINAQDGDGRTALINSVIEGKMDFLVWLLDQGADINIQDRVGYSALHFAASGLMHDIVELLLSRDADVNLVDKYGNPPLWTAVFAGKGKNLETLRLLLANGADMNIVNGSGRTPAGMFATMNKFSLDTLI